MSELLREAALEQMLRFFKRNKSLRYPEEEPNFSIPWQEAALKQKEKEIEAETEPVTPPASTDPELTNVARTISLAMIPTAALLGRLQSVASRIMSRE